jgi:hypothetical protein
MLSDIEAPSSGENIICGNSIWPLSRRPLAEKIFSFESPTPTSYKRSVDVICLNLTVFE